MLTGRKATEETNIMKLRGIHDTLMLLPGILIISGLTAMSVLAQARPGTNLRAGNRVVPAENSSHRNNARTIPENVSRILQEPKPAPGDELIPPGVAIKQRLALRRVFMQLSLSPEQHQKLKQLRQEVGVRLIVLSRLWKAQSDALEEALLGTDYDPKIVEKKIAELTETEAERTRLQYRILSHIRETLTPEQAAKFREMMREETQRSFNLPKAPLRHQGTQP
jgi:Spy/CpxP family protein refolding chaperone